MIIDDQVPDGHHLVRLSGPGPLTREQVARALTEFRTDHVKRRQWSA